MQLARLHIFVLGEVILAKRLISETSMGLEPRDACKRSRGGPKRTASGPIKFIIYLALFIVYEKLL